MRRSEILGLDDITEETCYCAHSDVPVCRPLWDPSDGDEWECFNQSRPKHVFSITDKKINILRDVDTISAIMILLCGVVVFCGRRWLIARYCSIAIVIVFSSGIMVPRPWLKQPYKFLLPSDQICYTDEINAIKGAYTTTMFGINACIYFMFLMHQIRIKKLSASSPIGTNDNTALGYCIINFARYLRKNGSMLQ
jgi:hypothetical protein